MQTNILLLTQYGRGAQCDARCRPLTQLCVLIRDEAMWEVWPVEASDRGVWEYSMMLVQGLWCETFMFFCTQHPPPGLYPPPPLLVRTTVAGVEGSAPVVRLVHRNVSDASNALVNDIQSKIATTNLDDKNNKNVHG